jgi:hypothetical protein
LWTTWSLFNALHCTHIYKIFNLHTQHTILFFIGLAYYYQEVGKDIVLRFIIEYIVASGIFYRPLGNNNNNNNNNRSIFIWGFFS